MKKLLGIGIMSVLITSGMVTSAQTTMKENTSVEQVKAYTDRIEGKFDSVMTILDAKHTREFRVEFYKKAFIVFGKVTKNIERSKLPQAQRKVFMDAFDRMSKKIVDKLLGLDIKIVYVNGNPTFQNVNNGNSSSTTNTNAGQLDANGNTQGVDTSITRDHSVHADGQGKEGEASPALDTFIKNFGSFLGSKDIKSLFGGNFEALFGDGNAGVSRQGLKGLMSQCKYEPKAFQQISDFSNRFKLAVAGPGKTSEIAGTTTNLTLSNLLAINNKFRMYYLYANKKDVLNSASTEYGNLGDKVWITLVEHQNSSQGQFYITRENKKVAYNAIIVDSKFNVYDGTIATELMSNKGNMNVTLYNALPTANCTK